MEQEINGFQTGIRFDRILGLSDLSLPPGGTIRTVGLECVSKATPRHLELWLCRSRERHVFWADLWVNDSDKVLGTTTIHRFAVPPIGQGFCAARLVLLQASDEELTESMFLQLTLWPRSLDQLPCSLPLEADSVPKPAAMSSASDFKDSGVSQEHSLPSRAELELQARVDELEALVGSLRCKLSETHAAAHLSGTPVLQEISALQEQMTAVQSKLNGQAAVVPHKELQRLVEQKTQEQLHELVGRQLQDLGENLDQRLFEHVQAALPAYMSSGAAVPNPKDGSFQDSRQAQARDQPFKLPKNESQQLSLQSLAHVEDLPDIVHLKRQLAKKLQQRDAIAQELRSNHGDCEAPKPGKPRSQIQRHQPERRYYN